MAAFVEGGMETRKSRAVSTAKFVVTGSSEVAVPAKRGEGKGSGGGVVVVEHEILQGFSGDLTAFGHEICEVGHKLALGNAFSEHVISYTNHVP